MQAYVDQIPPGARPPPVQVSRPLKARDAPPAPAGFYVQVADVLSQAEAIRASLDLSERLGATRPRFIRGEVRTLDGVAHILMFAGPFANASQAAAFCAAALSGAACQARTLGPGDPQTRGGASGLQRQSR